MTPADRTPTLEQALLTEIMAELKHLRLMQDLTRHCLAYLHCLATDRSPLGPVARMAETAPRLLADDVAQVLREAS